MQFDRKSQPTSTINPLSITNDENYKENRLAVQFFRSLLDSNRWWLAASQQCDSLIGFSSE
jgi:hypothetical protein